MKLIKKTITLILSLALLIGCANVASPDTALAASKKVALSKTSIVLIKGQTKTIKLSNVKSGVKWTSSKKSVASVSKSGKITAKKKGNAVITAKYKNKSYKCKVTVETPKISKTSLTLDAGESYKLKITGTTQKIKWSSSNEKIAVVDASGEITAIKDGTCYIKANILNKIYKCKVTVEEKEKQPSPSDTETDDETTDTGNTDNSENTGDTNTSYVYVSATGSKYHSIPNCGNMNPDKAIKMTEQEAISSGHSKCSKCF